MAIFERDTGTHISLLDVDNFVRVPHGRGYKPEGPEEIAYEKGWIDATDLKRLACADCRMFPHKPLPNLCNSATLTA